MELALLLLEPAQRLGAIFVEGALPLDDAAAATRCPRRACRSAGLGASGSSPTFPASHASAPDDEGEDRRDRAATNTMKPRTISAIQAGFPEFVEFGNDRHRTPHV